MIISSPGNLAMAGVGLVFAVITAQVRAIIETATWSLPVQELFFRILQPGRTRFVLAHPVLPAGYAVQMLAILDAVRAGAQAQLWKAHPAIIINLLFTADRAWGAPIGRLVHNP